MYEQWTWAAICRTSKLIIAWHVGKRDQGSADTLVADVRSRLMVMPQITTDGLALYEAPIAVNFGPAVPYMQTIKDFSARPARTPEGEKYAVPRGVDFLRKRTVYGSPDPRKATTYAIERSNLTARQWNARLRRRTLSFSKDLRHHKAAVALHYVHANMCHVPRNMRVTPAMASGVTDHVWTLEEFMEAALSETAGEKPRPKPLTIPKPEGNARELPAGRGWLKVVGSDGGKAAPSPSPEAPTPAPVAPLPETAPESAPLDDRQMDLFSWKPKPREPVQLSLFGEPPTP